MSALTSFKGEFFLVVGVVAVFVSTNSCGSPSLAPSGGDQPGPPPVTCHKSDGTSVHVGCKWCSGGQVQEREAKGRRTNLPTTSSGVFPCNRPQRSVPPTVFPQHS